MLKIGVIIADIEEYRPFAETVKKYDPHKITVLSKEGLSFKLESGGQTAEVVAVLCGIGKVNAAAVAAALAGAGCDIVLNFGLSGGISGAVRGQTVIANRFLEHDFDLTPLGFKPCEKPEQKYIYDADAGLVSAFEAAIQGIKSGTAVCGDRFICSNEDRLFFKENFEAMSCDMETAAIASVCDMAQIPFMALRRISDDAGDDAGDAYREMNNSGETLLSDMFLKGLEECVSRFGGKM